MDSLAGRECFLSVKNMAESGIGMWSYGYDVAEESRGEFQGKRVRFLKRVNVHEASPCLRGSGPTTRTLSAKNHDVTCDCGCHGGLSPELAREMRLIHGEMLRQQYLAILGR